MPIQVSDELDFQGFLGMDLEAVFPDTDFPTDPDGGQLVVPLTIIFDFTDSARGIWCLLNVQTGDGFPVVEPIDLWHIQVHVWSVSVKTDVKITVGFKK